MVRRNEQLSFAACRGQSSRSSPTIEDERGRWMSILACAKPFRLKIQVLCFAFASFVGPAPSCHAGMERCPCRVGADCAWASSEVRTVASGSRTQCVDQRQRDQVKDVLRKQ